MGKFNIIQFALRQALYVALLGLVCALLYPFVGKFFDLGITSSWPSSEMITSIGSFFMFLLQGLWALLKFLVKWLWVFIWIPWVFAIIGFAAGIVEGIVIKPFAGLFGSSG
ncbi:MAG: hypothetical protein OER83_05405 [Flavobacteriaceae bacterium]|nr:hypothetical protein [Flavobacteriaceae bacterium]MDH3796289.1 hypothetical protein [Flavobacteriaceae bacterium]